ncbi:MAG TPA: M20/M25/M40 family metallo-hydrolase [Phaeodactylibacter sp.]|nr:M20/M25/M40 family metallo-hydrolase [Phaeodactylibacter sp.]
MKYRILLLITFLVPCFLFAQSDLYQLTGSLLADSPIEENLQYLCDEIGGRVTGSAANERAVDWALAEFEKAGVKAWKDPFPMPVRWLAKSCRLHLKGKDNFQPQVVAKYQSPPGTYQGQLIFVGKGQEEDFQKKAAGIKGNILLVETDLCLDISGLFAEYAAAAATEVLAKKHGAKAIVFMSSRPKKLLYRFITSKATENDMPQLVMAREDAKRCIRMLEGGEKLSARIELEAQTGGAFTAHNVIAEIPGSEKPDEVVIIGAHIDSWALGTGANDNGCNVAMMIDIARQMKKLNIRPKRTIRFALWNGEEQGYFGSWDYTKEHEAELDNHIMMLSVDIGSGAITGFFTNGMGELVDAVDEVLKPVEALGDFTQVNIPLVGTDNFDFMLQGVANLIANQKPARYGPNYHAASDTYDKVDLKTLKVNSAIVAALTLGFANLADDKISWKRQSRSEIQKLFDTHKLEYTMRMFNVWEPWIKGERGRK